MLLKKNAPQPPPEPTADPVGLLDALLGVHGAINENWLIDAAAMAAERALGATHLLVYVLNNEGLLVGQAASGEGRRMADIAFEDAVGVGLTRKRFALSVLPAFAHVAATNQPLLETDLSVIYPAWFDEKTAREAQEALGIRSICLAPLWVNGQSLGVVAFLFPYEIGSPALPNAIAMHVARAIANHRELKAASEYGHVDRLTGAYDERKLIERLDQETRRAQRYGRQLSLVLARVQNYVDLDHRFGRFLAERLLRLVGGVLYDEIRESDFLGTYEESGFAVILTETDAPGAQGAIARLTRAAGAVRIDDQASLSAELSWGWATVPDDGTAADVLLAAAAERLAAQGSGRQAASPLDDHQVAG